MPLKIASIQYESLYGSFSHTSSIVTNKLFYQVEHFSSYLDYIDVVHVLLWFIKLFPGSIGQPVGKPGMQLGRIGPCSVQGGVWLIFSFSRAYPPRCIVSESGLNCLSV